MVVSLIFFSNTAVRQNRTISSNRSGVRPVQLLLADFFVD